jgi:hypothetical protein
LGQDGDNFRLMPEEITGAGAMVIARGRYIGTHKQTGIALDAEYVHKVIA